MRVWLHFIILIFFSFFVQKLWGVYQTFLGFKNVEKLWGGSHWKPQKTLLNAIPSSIKTKYKQLKLRTYDINFDKTKYDMYGGSSFWNISIYDNNNNNVLYN